MLWGAVEDPETGCWLFQRATDSGGYAMIRAGGRNVRGHVVTAEVLFGPLDREHVDHLCRVRRCVSPHHLDPVSPLENNRRANLANLRLPIQGPRRAPGGGRFRSECRRGHAMTPDNVYLRPDGRGRQCRQCIKIRSAR